MSELLPCYLTGDEHPFLISMVRAYRPHTAIPSRQELLTNEYQLINHCNIRDLCKDVGFDYDLRTKTNKDT